jgi:SAM-dependent methyltransferase
MKREHMDPLGRALTDHLDGEARGPLAIVREDGRREEVPLELFFAREPTSAIEHAALSHCACKVLDVGGGAGRHALFLQRHNVCVGAIDISPLAVDVMKRRGVRCARCMDVFDLTDRKYNTILMLAHGLGITETLDGLERFLRHARDLVAPGGQILAESLDVARTEKPEHLAYQQSVVDAGRYRGEMRFRLEYGGESSAEFGWLHVDFDTVREVADRTGWDAECLLRDEGGDYLCKLTRRDEADA